MYTNSNIATFSSNSNLMKFFTVECDWQALLKETAQTYGLWKKMILPKVPPEARPHAYEPTLTKNVYNVINLTTPLPEYYKFWKQVYDNIRSELDGPIWIHAWLNIHRNEDLGKESLEWHTHSYANYHGFVHISDKATTTEFKNGKMIPNNQGQMYFGDASLEHRVVAGQFEGIRASIGYDLLLDPQPEHFDQDIFIPIL